jgi:subtilisin
MGKSGGRNLMLRLVRLLVVLGLASLGIAPVAQASSGPAKGYIVVLKSTTSDPGAAASELGTALGFHATFVYGHALKGFAAPLPPSAVKVITADPRVAFLEPDTPMSAAACPPTGQCLPNWANRVDADTSSARSGDGTGTVNINVAVIDSGIDFTHPDLHVVGGVNCTEGKGFGDPYGHGTVVAGIIGAKDNDFGVVGVVPGANLYAVRVINKNGTGSTSSILCGIDWVTATRTDADPSNDIAVANMSIGGSGNDDGKCGHTKKAVHQAICSSIAAGVTYVVSAGNDSKDFQNTVPAAYDEVLTATAMADGDGQPGGLQEPGCESGQADDVAAFFSNYATLAADQVHTIAAPGVCDLSTYTGGIYAIGVGTSFASPVVAGTVALCIASGPCAGLTPAQIVQKIVSDATAYNAVNPGYGFTGDPQHNPDPNKYYGYLIRSGLY